MNITHERDEDLKLFDCPRQDYGNCTCTNKCENNNPEL